MLLRKNNILRVSDFRADGVKIAKSTLPYSCKKTDALGE